MKGLHYFSVFILTVVLLALSGCGGSSGPLDALSGGGFSPRGEGNIPIGRAHGVGMGESSVSIVMSDGRTYSTFTKLQVIHAPALPKGVTTVTVTPGNRKFSRHTFQYVVGPDQYWAFNVYPVDRVSTQVVKDLDVNLRSGRVFRVGDKYDLEIQTYGANLDGLKPSLSINGGIARLDSNDDLMFTKAGTGELVIELLGVQKVLTLFVEP